jgi:hypothetical protein
MAKKPISVPFVPYEYLRKVSEEFLIKHHPTGAIPVPVEEIIEFQFGLDIVPTPGLHEGFDIDAFITNDLTTIYVDDFVYRSRPGRYRFSLAHELAHLILHAEVFKQLHFSTIEEWKETIGNIPEKEYSSLEWQAYALAGLILVPTNALAEHFQKAAARLPAAGLSLKSAAESDVARHIIESALARDFLVSAEVIERRANFDGLWRLT